MLREISPARPGTAVKKLSLFRYSPVFLTTVLSPMVLKLLKYLFALPLGLMGGATAGTLFDVFFARMIEGSRTITGLDWLDVRFDQNLTKVIWAGAIWMVLTNLTMGFIIGRLIPYQKIVARILSVVGSLLVVAVIVWTTYYWMDWDLALLLGTLGLVGVSAGLAGVSFGVHQIPELLGDNQNGYKF